MQEPVDSPPLQPGPFRRWHIGVALVVPLALGMALGVAGCAGQQDASTATAQSLQAAQPQKSPNDDWAYRYLVLKNGLRMLLVSDPEADKAAASLVAFRGSYHDPADRAGLAHFLEHMLFIATDKYPEIDGYQAFITANGGNSNAYTASDHTNYFFDIDPAAFADGMDRFAQFFIAPSLDAASVERERNTVDSEYRLQMKDDGWRNVAASKMALNPDHPGARFNIGNLETLGQGTHRALKKFFARNYSADQMALVALSNQDLDEMQGWIAPMFGAIPNRRLGPAPITAAPYSADGLPATMLIQPQKEIRSVTYRFPIPTARPHYQAKPVEYIINLLGHEGEGSLHAALKAKGWIESLTAANGPFDDAHDFLEITIQLTRSGAKQVDAISSTLFAYIDLLRSNVTNAAWRYDEQARLADLAFRFQEHSNAQGFVYRMGPKLALIPPEDLLREPYLMEEFDQTLTIDYLSFLRPENVLLQVVAPEVQTDAVEPWFKVPYALKRGPIALANADIKLHLPAANPFIPEDLSLLTHDDQPPRRIETKQGGEVWVDTDLEFGVPRANLRLLLTVPSGFKSPTDQVAALVYRELVLDRLNEYAYPANLAGLSYRLSIAPEGYDLEIGGFNDRQPLLLGAVLRALANVEIREDKLKRYRAELVQHWRNFASERPFTQTYAALSQALVDNRWPQSNLADAAKHLGLAELRSWRERRLASYGLIALMQGNLNESAAASLLDTISKELPLAPIGPTRPEVVRLDGSYLLPIAIDHADASVVLYAQNDQPGIDAQAHSALAQQLIGQAFFTQLRTEQQLGYVVAAVNANFHHQAGLAFIVQSPVASPAALEQAILSFLDQQVPALEALSDEDFATNQAGLISALRAKDQNLHARAERMWRNLNLGITSFDYRRQLAERVKRLNKRVMVEFLRRLRDRAHATRLVIYNLGQFSEAPTDGQLVEEPSGFK